MTACSRLLLVGALLFAFGCERGPAPIQLTVWHTELDPRARALVDSIADEVEAELATDSLFAGYQVSFNVTALDWGDVATRLFTSKDRPPDVTHLQPFMLTQVLHEFQGTEYRLLALDTLISQMERDYGPIEPSVRHLQSVSVNGGRDTLTYGLAYAVGTTFIAYREDWNSGGMALPTTWESLVDFGDSLRASQRRRGGPAAAAFILPGGSSFFVDQLFNEMVVSLGGSLYRNGEPRFDSPESRRALHVLQDMVARTDGKYSQTSYLQQFDLFASGEGAIVPVTYGRATKRIEAMIDTTAGDSASKRRLREGFRVIPQPGPSAGIPGVASIDAEPWVIFAKRESDEPATIRVRAAQRFLQRFYHPDNYRRFIATVPVHLRPIFQRQKAYYDSLPEQTRWPHWVKVGTGMLARDGGSAPILLDPPERQTPVPSFALEMQRTAVVSDLVLEAASDEVVAAIKARLEGRADPKEAEIRSEAIRRALHRAQTRATQLHAQSTR